MNTQLRWNLDTGLSSSSGFVYWTTNSASGFDKPRGACFISNILSMSNNNIIRSENALLSFPSGATITKAVLVCPLFLLKEKNA